MESKCISVPFHDRPVTEIKYNKDGDLMFACSKDSTATMYNTTKGSLIGDFCKHSGAINAIEPIEFELFTCSSDMTMINWDIMKGECLHIIDIDGVIKGVTSDNGYIYYVTDNSMNKQSHIGMYDPRTKTTIRVANMKESSTSLFKHNNDIIVSDLSGGISKIDEKNGELLAFKRIHQKAINSVRSSACGKFFCTGSSDSTAKIIDTKTFDIKRKFTSEEPVNCAVICPENDILIAVGGVYAWNVTTTRGKSTFDTNFYDIATSEKIGFYNTHTGTINAVDVHPGGMQYSSGAEDGVISLVNLGEDLKKAPFTRL